MSRLGRVLAAVAVAAALGLALFGWMASRAITIEAADPAEASQRFEEALARFENRTPLLVRNDAGAIVPNPDAPPPRAEAVGHLYVLAYRAASRRTVRADVPMWFYELKAPAAQFLVEDTGFDLNTLGLTAAELRRHGPGVIADFSYPSGDRVLIFTG